MEALPLFLSLGGRPVLVVGEGEAAAAKRRLVAEAGGRPVAAPEPGTRLAFLVPAEGASDAEVAAEAERLKAAGLLVNVVDRPALCDFFVPAIVDRAPVTLAIGTGGASASLAKALKERLDLLLPASLGPLARAIRAARAAVASAHPTVPGRRAFWARLLAPGAPLDPLAPADDPAAAITRALAGAPADAPDSLVDIRVPPGGVDALTLGEARLLAAADLVLVDGGVDAAVLALVRRDAARVTGAEVPPGARGRIVRLRARP